jgi:ATP-binding cassette subfamily F protein 3
MANEDFYKKSQTETDKILDGYHKLCSELNLLFAEWEQASS